MRLAVALLVLVGIGAAAKTESDDGRYQLVQLGDARADQFLLDTRTGQIWRAKCASFDSADRCVAHLWERERVAP